MSNQVAGLLGELNGGFKFEIEALPFFLPNDEPNNIKEALRDIESQQAALEKRLDELNVDIDRLTNKSDSFDYIIAACSGVLCGAIDSFFVGEFNFEAAKANAHEQANRFVEKYAKVNGWNGEGRLAGAVKHLENKFPVIQDDSFHRALQTGKEVSSSKLHHLEDLAHHPTPMGLLFAFVVAFFRCAVFVDKDGKWHAAFLDMDNKELAKLWTPILISGLLLWLVNVAESRSFEKNGKQLPKPLHKLLTLIACTPGIIDILKVSHNWFGHLVSDMAGSKQTAGKGMGLPGLFLSLLKELSSLPFLKDTSLPKLVSNWYSKVKFDMRSGLAVVEFLGKQTVPILINESLVRTFYFAHRLVEEKRQHMLWKDVNWSNVVPWGNRTIVRMLTISSATFTVIDVADSAIRTTIKNGSPYNPLFWKDLILSINFVGIGRCAVAVETDIKMGVERSHDIQERMFIMNQSLLLDNAKIFIKQAGVWESAVDTAKAIDKLETTAVKSVKYINDAVSRMDAVWMECKNTLTEIVKNDQTVGNELMDILNPIR